MMTTLMLSFIRPSSLQRQQIQIMTLAECTWPERTGQFSLPCHSDHVHSMTDNMRGAVWINESRAGSTQLVITECWRDDTSHHADAIQAHETLLAFHSGNVNV